MPEKHLVFLLHGMGQHDSTWADKGMKAFREGWGSLGIDPEAHHVTFELIPIDYSKVFDLYWESAAQQAQSFQNVVLPSSAPKVIQSFLSLIKQSPSDSFWLTHFGDVAMYRFSPHGDKIVHDIALKIAEAAREHGSPPYSIIAHSLGTSVATDVVRYMLEDASSPFRHLAGKPDVIMMLANVSRLLERRDMFGPASTMFASGLLNKGACRHYIDVAHPLDPFTWLRPFSPPSLWGDAPSNIKRFHAPALERLDLTPPFNPHGIEHYLSHPVVQAEFLHRTLRPRLADKTPLESGVLQQAVTRYRSKAPTGQFKQLKADLEAFDTTLPRDAIGRWKRMKEFVELLEGYEPKWGVWE